MKIVFPVLGLIALLGAAYGLAFFGVIPTQKMADKTPALRPVLISLHLARAKKPGSAAKPLTAAKPGAAVSPEQKAMGAQKKQIATARAQLDKDRAAFEAQKQQTAGSGLAAAPDNAAKLNDIYAAMSPDDLAPIFAKLPDSDVTRALLAMDEKKAGKILAALPAARAARLTRQMTAPRQTASAGL